MMDIDWKNDRRRPLPGRPSEFTKMRTIAQELVAEIDDVRVNFLCGETEATLNALTFYESRGFAAYPNPAVALRFGQLWNHRKYDGDWGKAASIPAAQP